LEHFGSISSTSLPSGRYFAVEGRVGVLGFAGPTTWDLYGNRWDLVQPKEKAAEDAE
jgi:hypothetical protein